jgi:hypothetical protein
MSITLDFSDELTIRTIEGAYEKLSEAMKGDDGLLISVSADSATDLTFVQLIETGRRAAQQAGRKFALAAPATGPLRETLRRGGFLETPDRRAFWLLEAGDH